MTGYSFKFITDERWGGTRTQLEEMDLILKEKFISFNSHVSLLDNTDIYELNWGEHQKQWRKEYVVRKRGRGYTWDQIFHVINSIYSPVYEKEKTIKIYLGA